MISLPLLQKIVAYLEHQPFNQVAGLLSEVKQEWDAAQTKAVPVAETKTDGPA